MILPPAPRARAAALLAAAVGLAAPPVRAAFERPPRDPAAAALGGLSALAPGAVFGNPAAAAGEPGARIAFSAGRPFGIPALSEGQAGADGRLAGVRLGVGLHRFGAAGGAWSEKELRVRAAVARGAAAVGLALRGLAVSGEGFAPRRSAAIDVGLLVEPEDGLVVGVVVEAVAGEVPGDPRGTRRRTALGVSRRAGRRLGVLAEVQRREDRPLAGVLGVAWRPAGGLALLAGLRQEPAAASAGVVLGSGRRTVSVAAVRTPPLGLGLRIGVAIGAPP